MKLTGSQLIGFSESRLGQESYHSISPQDNTVIKDVEFVDATAEEINKAVQLAESAFDGYRSLTKEQRADFLDAIADQILAIGDQLISKCHSETALPEGRLIGERGRTMNQLKLFAEVVRQGQWVDARIDRADPDRQPIPKADIRSMLIPLGPVAVFGASNFPLAFSVAGGDTASALAAGCPVVFKAHPAHPATSELVGRAIVEAARQTAMPDGVFSMVHGRSHAGGIALVKHPLIRAVSFTGSQSGGLALFQIANAREEPIPVYAEMGSVNPVFILPGAMRARAKSIASGLAKSINLGVGQFCTNPGLVIAEKNEDLDGFLKILDEEIRNSEAGTMLTSGIFQSFEAGKKSLSEHEGVKLASEGPQGEGPNAARASLFITDAEILLEDPDIAEEVFGPSSVLVQSGSKRQLIQAAENLEGHLTATIHADGTELATYQELISVLERKVGRLIINGFPTGVEVCHAMVHGGPYPSTTDSRTTSVGTAAIRRFGRPVCYQDFSQTLLPDALKDGNPWGIIRTVDGKLTEGIS